MPWSSRAEVVRYPASTLFDATVVSSQFEVQPAIPRTFLGPEPENHALQERVRRNDAEVGEIDERPPRKRRELC